MDSAAPDRTGRSGMVRFLRRRPEREGSEETKDVPARWTMGMLNDKQTMEVPGSVLLLAAHRNEPLGLRNVHARTSHSSIPAGFHVDLPLTPGGSKPAVSSPAGTPGGAAPAAEDEDERKKTDDGAIILYPQPEESANDPLNWPSWRRDLALLSLGFYCMIGGGITPLIAAGFTNVAATFHVPVERVSLTTGLYMMGLGVGSVIASPIAILWGKRPVYLAGAIIFILTSVWAALSKSFTSLLVARVFMGVAISPVECLPSATIAEIFFLHERAYRIGIYTLLLLGGKNLVPLVSAAIIGSFGWRWVFWIVGMVAALGFVLLFLFVPETFWDRTPTRKPNKRPSFLRRLSSHHTGRSQGAPLPVASGADGSGRPLSPTVDERPKDRHVGFAEGGDTGDQLGQVPTNEGSHRADSIVETPTAVHHRKDTHVGFSNTSGSVDQAGLGHLHEHAGPHATSAANHASLEQGVSTPGRGGLSPVSTRSQRPDMGAFNTPYSNNSAMESAANVDYFSRGPNLDMEKIPSSMLTSPPRVRAYTHNLRQQPPKSFVQQLKPFNGRLNNDKYLKVMVRPFVLFAYPAVLWSAAIYACSIGWLIVISESIAQIFRSPDTYNFGALAAGLIYVSPFVGGILGTAVAGKVSDLIVRVITRRNGGLYEPEFRLVMVVPILFTTCIGIMGFGWSAQVKDSWIVPTIFFGILSFGCSLGSTTSITFCVDSYRQYAGEALVTLNFSKNVLHGLVFSLFVTNWLEDDGPKMVYIYIGIIQLIILLFTIPMYIYGKRARMWTARMNFMERF